MGAGGSGGGHVYSGGQCAVIPGIHMLKPQQLYINT